MLSQFNIVFIFKCNFLSNLLIITLHSSSSRNSHFFVKHRLKRTKKRGWPIKYFYSDMPRYFICVCSIRRAENFNKWKLSGWSPLQGRGRDDWPCDWPLRTRGHHGSSARTAKDRYGAEDRLQPVVHTGPHIFNNLCNGTLDKVYSCCSRSVASLKAHSH